MASCRVGGGTLNHSQRSDLKQVTPSWPSPGPHVHGFYIFATDRAPKPTEWKYLTQGMINIDGAPFAFSILTNDGQESVLKAAMDLIRDASYHPRKT
jgi:hypothetical protein